MKCSMQSQSTSIKQLRSATRMCRFSLSSYIVRILNFCSRFLRRSLNTKYRLSMQLERSTSLLSLILWPVNLTSIDTLWLFYSRSWKEATRRTMKTFVRPWWLIRILHRVTCGRSQFRKSALTRHLSISSSSCWIMGWLLLAYIDWKEPLTTCIHMSTRIQSMTH